MTNPEVIGITQVYEDKEDGRIKVTITTSEEIFGDLLGSSKWRKVNGKNEYYNYYYSTQEVTINFQDKAGNEGTYTFTVDMTKPTAEVTMSNNNGNSSTNEDVTVTLTASEDIQDIEDWIKVDSKTFTKVFTDNVKNYQVEITDLVGNKNTITFEVKRIDKVPPVLTITNPESYDIEAKTPYVEKGYSAYDVVDKDVTNRVTMTYEFLARNSNEWQEVPSIDTSVIGTYRITYKVTDKANNSAEETREFRIVDTSNPKFNVENTKHFDDNVTISVEDFEFDYMEVYNQDTKETTKYDTSSIELTDEATYKITAYDKSENFETIWIAIDKTMVKITGTAFNGENVNLDSTVGEITGDFQNVKLTFEDKFLTTVIVSDGLTTEEFTRADFEVNSNNEDFKFSKEFDVKGTYTVKAYDKFGHETVATFTIDQSKPVESASNIKIADEPNEQGVYYAENGDVVAIYVVFDEELKHKPTFALINNGITYPIDNEDIAVTSDEKGYKYQVLFAITEDLIMNDGEIKMHISNIEDKAGNKYPNITEPTNRHVVYLDRVEED